MCGEDCFAVTEFSVCHACQCFFFISPFSRFFESNGLSLPTSLAGLAVNELGETDTNLEGLHLAVVEVTD